MEINGFLWKRNNILDYTNIRVNNKKQKFSLHWYSSQKIVE